MDLDPSFPGPISITPDRQISPLFSDPFSPRAASKLFSSTHPKPLSPTDGRKDRFSSVLTAVSPRTGKRDILSKTPKVASPKAEGKTKLVNGLIAEDQDSGVAEIPQKVEMQTDILWSQANTQNTNALAEPIVSHPLADRMSLNYSSMYGAEDDFRAHVSSIGADMDEGTPPDHECLVIGAGLPISSPLSYHEEYEDNSISNGTNDDWLPIVMPAKKLISNENLKAILSRTSNERIYAEMFLPSIGWSLPSRIQPLLAAINSCKIPEFSYDLSWLNHAWLLDESQVVTEVNVMVQNCVGLELRDSSYYLAPRWVAIFRRIYNWRLAKLCTGKFSEAYVLTQHLYQAPAAAGSNGTTQGLTANTASSDDVDHIMMPAISTGITLDEIIEISCDLDVVDVQPITLPPRLHVHVHEEPQAVTDNNGVHGVDEMYIPRRVELGEVMPIDTDDKLSRLRVELGEVMPIETDDKLSRLLEQCTKLQDRIDETLSIYF
ncbi:SAC3 family protein B [Zea mays]|uniref:SAC3 family protein B n=1 Tax=Zea mays TaxID=4577 RepID=K7VTX5_MAIZE|nr:SAC3 family protein B [Zea mays]